MFFKLQPLNQLPLFVFCEQLTFCTRGMGEQGKWHLPLTEFYIFIIMQCVQIQILHSLLVRVSSHTDIDRAALISARLPTIYIIIAENQTKPWFLYFDFWLKYALRSPHKNVNKKFSKYALHFWDTLRKHYNNIV